MAKPKVFIVMPAFNAEKTIAATVRGIPKKYRLDVLVVDDASTDRTTAAAKQLGLRTITHPKNRGYGGNLKTCLSEARRVDLDVTVELHPDNQYDPQSLPLLIQKVAEGNDLVIGSRFAHSGSPGRYGMHWYRILANRLLSAIDRRILGLPLSEFHSGFRAYSRRFLRIVPFERCHENYTFSFEVIAQAVFLKLKVSEIPVISRYTNTSRSASLKNATIYAMQMLFVLGQFLLQKFGVWSFPLFAKNP